MDKNELLDALKRRGFSDEILQAFDEVDRGEFIPEGFSHLAYIDQPVALPRDQFTSQPSTIAFMLDLLNLEDKKKILEVGSGSGYVLALMAHICPNSTLYGIERIKELQEFSEERLKDYQRVLVFHGDGTKGYKTQAPYDRILVSAVGDGVPSELLRQLADGGIMVIPIKNSIYKITKRDHEVTKEEYPGFSFVPLKEGVDISQGPHTTVRRGSRNSLPHH